MPQFKNTQAKCNPSEGRCQALATTPHSVTCTLRVIHWPQQTQPTTSIGLILTLPKWHLATYEAACLVSTKRVVKKNNSRKKTTHQPWQRVEKINKTYRTLRTKGNKSLNGRQWGLDIRDPSFWSKEAEKVAAIFKHAEIDFHCLAIYLACTHLFRCPALFNINISIQYF